MHRSLIFCKLRWKLSLLDFEQVFNTDLLHSVHEPCIMEVSLPINLKIILRYFIMSAAQNYVSVTVLNVAV